MRLRLRRALFGMSILLVLLVGLAWWSWTPGARPMALGEPPAPLPAAFRTWEEHDAIYGRDREPYVYEWTRAGSSAALCYVGVFHGVDPAHGHRRAIDARFAAFAPTVALCEGRARGHFTEWPFALLPQGEPAQVHALARRAGIPIHSLEPPYEREVAALLEVEPPPRVALYLTLRGYWSESGGAADEALFADLLAKRSDVDGLRGALPDVGAADAAWASLAAEHGDWRTRHDEPRGTWLANLSERSRITRGEHMVRLLAELVGRGERVFAVVGRSHVIRHEPTLAALLGG